MSSKPDSNIAEMGKAVFEFLGAPKTFHLGEFRSAFAEEAHSRGIYQNKQFGYKTPEHIYYNNLFTEVMKRVKCYIKHPPKEKSPKTAPSQEQKARHIKKVTAAPKTGQLRLF